MSRRGNGEGSIYKDGDRWVAAIVTDVGGKKVRRKFTGTTRRTVAARLVAAQRAVAQGLPIAPERLNLSDYLVRWLDESARPGLRPRVFESYEMIVRRHLIPALGSLRLVQLSPRDVQGFLATKQKAGLSARTIQYQHAVLRRALRDAERLGLVQRNVARLVSPPRVETKEVVPPTAAEVRTFFIAIAGHRDEALFILAVATGLRQSELLGLTWADIDFDGHKVTVRRTLQRYERAYHLDEPKTQRSRRTLHVPPPVETALLGHRVRQMEEQLRLGSTWANSWDLVFTDSFGSPRSGIQLTRSYQALLEAARPTLRLVADHPFRFVEVRRAASDEIEGAGLGGHHRIAQITPTELEPVTGAVVPDRARE